MASLYRNIVRPILFRYNPEKIHNFTFTTLRAATGLRFPLRLMGSLCSASTKEPVRLWDLEFPNPVGLAAGMDKDGEVIEAMLSMGFGFLELGTVTPEAQPGNPKPRLFRYPDTHAIVNRMGFNNAGAEALRDKVATYRKLHPHKGVIGINIGKQKDTPIEKAIADYTQCFETVADLADYVAVNISSPNTKNLRKLQDRKHLETMLTEMKYLNLKRMSAGKRQVPMLLKIAPDLSTAQIETITQLVMEYGWSGIIATNTTINRKGENAHYETPGGLSGKPLRERSTEVIRTISATSGGDLPIIGVGGIENADDVKEKLDAGASLLQVYSGFIYEGPRMVRRIVKQLESA